MAKRYHSLDSGLIVPYWHAPTRDRSTIRRERDFMFTPSGACGCCGSVLCTSCSATVDNYDIDIGAHSLTDTIYCDNCDQYDSTVTVTRNPALQCLWRYDNTLCTKTVGGLVYTTKQIIMLRLDAFVGGQFRWEVYAELYQQGGSGPVIKRYAQWYCPAFLNTNSDCMAGFSGGAMTCYYYGESGTFTQCGGSFPSGNATVTEA
jgi:hypothetical protein